MCTVKHTSSKGMLHLQILLEFIVSMISSYTVFTIVPQWQNFPLKTNSIHYYIYDIKLQTISHDTSAKL
jgi:hypothetical protein